MNRSRLVIPLVAVPALLGLGLAGTASAAPSTPAVGFSSTVPAAAKPNSNIGGKPAKYTPSSLTAKLSGSKPVACTAAKVSFTLTNTTAKAQTVTLGGNVVGTLKPKVKAGICLFGTGTGTATFGLKSNAKAKLAVHLS